MSSLSVLFLLLAIVGYDAFVVTPPSHAFGVSSRRPRTIRVRWRGPPGYHEASPRLPPDSIDEVRQRLLSSPEYDKLVNRVGVNNPFGDKNVAGVTEEEAEDPAAFRLLWSTVRFAVNVGIVLVAVVLCVSSGKLPPSILAPFESVATSISGSPIEQVLATWPWETTLVLRFAAEGLVALIFSPVADRLVVAPAIHMWGQFRLWYISS